MASDVDSKGSSTLAKWKSTLWDKECARLLGYSMNEKDVAYIETKKQAVC